MGSRAVEYLVTMTTHVPVGTPEQAVGEVRAREDAHTRELAAQGHVLRLWRPPLQPGEWRTLGLFAAGDDATLERVLASMPLRIWRTDQVTALLPHPNDPGPAAGAGAGGAGQVSGPGQEFLTTFTASVPERTPRETVDHAEAREAVRARELAAQGHLIRLWAVADGSGERSLGLWRARDPAEIRAVLESLPLRPFMTVDTTPLTPHPSDPALASGR